MSGSYEEKLKTGGKLIVKNDNWYIQYYFPGPDLRYNGKFLSLDGNCIDNYISSWKENFEKCKKLEKEIPENGNADVIVDRFVMCVLMNLMLADIILVDV